MRSPLPGRHHVDRSWSKLITCGIVAYKPCAYAGATSAAGLVRRLCITHLRTCLRLSPCSPRTNFLETSTTPPHRWPVTFPETLALKKQKKQPECETTFRLGGKTASKDTVREVFVSVRDRRSDQRRRKLNRPDFFFWLTCCTRGLPAPVTAGGATTSGCGGLTTGG